MTKKSHKKKAAARQKRNVAIIATIVVMIAVIGSIWFFINQQRISNAPKDEFSRERQLDDVARQADQKAQSEGTDEGAKLYDEAITSTSDQKEKSELMASKASLYLNEGKNAEALRLALEADKLHDSSEVSALVAQIYEATGNKVKAAEYYKKAARLVDVAQPLGPSDKAYFEGKAKELGGTR